MCIFGMFLIKNLRYNELSQKTRFQSVTIVALCRYNIQREICFFFYLSVVKVL